MGEERSWWRDGCSSWYRLLDVIAGVLLWRGRRSGVLLGLATDPIALALRWGFALPLLLIAVPVRGLLVIVGLRRIQ